MWLLLVAGAHSKRGKDLNLLLLLNVLMTEVSLYVTGPLYTSAKRLCWSNQLWTLAMVSGCFWLNKTHTL